MIISFFSITILNLSNSLLVISFLSRIRISIIKVQQSRVEYLVIQHKGVLGLEQLEVLDKILVVEPTEGKIPNSRGRFIMILWPDPRKVEWSGYTQIAVVQKVMVGWQQAEVWSLEIVVQIIVKIFLRAISHGQGVEQVEGWEIRAIHSLQHWHQGNLMVAAHKHHSLIKL